MMKIKIWDRLTLFFGALLTIVSGAALVVAGMQIAGFIGEALPLWARVACICVGALNVMFGAYLLAFPRKFRSGRRDFVVQRTDNGELRISVKAIEGLVQKCIDMHDEIRVVSTRIHNTRDGVMVDLNIALANNISIPLAVAALQKQIKQYLSASSGIDVTEVRVSVDTAQMNLGKDEPLPPEIEEEEDAAEEPREIPEEPAKAPKVPLHQRIFGRPDTPVNMPEPPKAEEIAPAAEPVEEPAEVPAEEPAEAPAPEQEAEIAEAPAEEIVEEIKEEIPAENAAETEAYEAAEEAPAEAAETEPSEAPATEDDSPEDTEEITHE